MANSGADAGESCSPVAAGARGPRRSVRDVPPL